MRVTVVVPELEVGDGGPFSIGDEVLWALVVRSAGAGPSWWFASEHALDMRPTRVIRGNGEALTEYVGGGVVAYHHAQSDLTRIDALVRDDVLAATYVTEESVPLTPTWGVVRRIRKVVWKVERREANMWDDTPQTFVMTDVEQRRFDEPAKEPGVEPVRVTRPDGRDEKRPFPRDVIVGWLVELDVPDHI